MNSLSSILKLPLLTKCWRCTRHAGTALALVILIGSAAHGGLALGATLPRTVDLNLANQAELEMVKGVGPQLSDRILQERERGPFVDWTDFIGRMKGIGPTHASRLSAAGMRINGQAFVASTDQAGSGAAPGPAAK